MLGGGGEVLSLFFPLPFLSAKFNCPKKRSYRHKWRKSDRVIDEKREKKYRRSKSGKSDGVQNDKFQSFYFKTLKTA